MIKHLPADLRAKALWCYGSSGPKAIVKTLLTDGTMAMVLYRLMQQSRRWRLGPLAMAFNKLNGVFCRCIIGRGAEFGPGFVLVHSDGVVINSAVKGGRNVFVEHQVTIGSDQERGRAPVLGDDVFLGAGCKVVGALTIGDGARVGANSLVIRDVPPGCSVLGVPAQVVRLPGGGHAPGA